MRIFVVLFFLFLVCNGDSSNRNEDQTRRLDALEKVVNEVQQQNQRLEETVKMQQMEITELKIQLANVNVEHQNGHKNLSASDFEIFIKDTVSKMLTKNEILKSNDESSVPTNEAEFLIKDTGSKLHDNNISSKPGLGMQYVHEPANGVTSNEERKRAVSGQAVAFYAVLSHDEKAPSAHHTLVFDNAKTNVQGAYNQYSGTFTAPVAGVYVFTFSIHMGCHAYASFEIVKNADVEGVVFLDVTEACDSEQVTWTTVSQLGESDIVYVRTHSTRSISGDIISDTYGMSSFAGWLLSV
ncbi:complement C1q-like protein 2 [Mytilus edulis]|uniref:complement C1q-like protein 2 n=1 Tax=Mytilus edulis TaxID=6550 RepID=UPI0039F1170D